MINKMQTLMYASEKAKKWTTSPLYLSLLALIFCLPLPYGLNREWAWSLFEASIFLLFVIWLFGYQRGDNRLTKAFVQSKCIVIGLSVLVLWQLVQIAPIPLHILKWVSPHAWEFYLHVPGISETSWATISLDVYATWQSILLTLAYTLLLVLTLLLVDSREKLKMLLYVVFFAGVLQSVIASVLLLGYIEGIFTANTHAHTVYTSGSFVNRNHLAGFLEISIAAGIGLMLSSLSFRNLKDFKEWLIWLASVAIGNKTRLRLFLVIMIIVLVLTRSRMGNMAFFMSFFSISALYLYAFIRRSGRSHSIKPALILLASMLIIDIVIVGNWFGMDKIVEKVSNTTAVEETRNDVFADASIMLKDFWLPGIGGGAFASSFMAYQENHYSEIYDHVHNDYLEFALELGIPVFVILTVIMTSVLIVAVRILFYSSSRLYTAIVFASLLGIVSILVHSLVDFNLHIPANAAYFILLLSMVLIVRGMDTSLDSKSNGSLRGESHV